VPHLNKSLAGSNKNPFHHGFLTGIATLNSCELGAYLKWNVTIAKLEWDAVADMFKKLNNILS